MRQFIESMFYLDVVRCRKCRGGVGEFYTAPALFLHCASIYFLHKIATRKSGSLFYFFDLLSEDVLVAEICIMLSIGTSFGDSVLNGNNAKNTSPIMEEYTLQKT